MKKINDTTWKEKPKDDPRDRIEVEVGDSKQDDFYPQSKLMRWDNEVNFSVRLRDVDRRKKQTFKEKDGKALWDQGNFKAEFFEADNAHKFVWYLKEKPDTNKISFSIQSKGLNFFYQPPLELTEEEEEEKGWRIDREYEQNGEVGNAVLDGDGNVRRFRPEDVVGSYAVYHSTKGGSQKANGKKYKTGKAFHIYRPKIIDAEGKETWGSLKIEDGTYTVEIPQDFLDKAVYPIKSNDTFGYDTKGEGLVYYKNKIQGSHFSLGDDADVSSITHWDHHGSSGRDANVKSAIYYKSDDSLIEVTEEDFHSFGGYEDKEWTLDFLTNPSLSSGQNYWLVAWTDAYISMYFDSGDTDQSGYQDETYNGYPDPFNPDGRNDRKFSIYATYTAAENTPPDEPFNPEPSDGATNVATDTTLSVDVSDDDGDSMDVSFYWDDDTLIEEVTGVSDGGTAETSALDLDGDTTYDWYAVADDGEDTTQSSTWSFTTESEATDTDSERDLEIIGQDSTDSERDLEISGGESVNSERDAELTGQQTDSGEREIELEGESAEDSANSERDIELTGQSSLQSERDIEIVSDVPYLKKVEQTDSKIELTWEY